MAIVVLVASEVETIGSILKEYKLAAVSKTNAHNWICDWIERPVKLPAINLVPTSRFRRTAIKCRRGWLVVIKMDRQKTVRIVIANAYITSIIIYHRNVVTLHGYSGKDTLQWSSGLSVVD